MALSPEDRDLVRAEVASTLNQQNVDSVQQLERHRNFLQSQQRWLVTGFIFLVITAAAVVTWIFGERIPEQINDKMIEYRIVEKLDPKFTERIQITIENIIKTKQANLDNQIDKLINKAKADLTNQANKEVSNAEEALQSESKKLIEMAIRDLGQQNTKQLDATANAVSRLVLGEVRQLSFIFPGMIVPFIGERSVAETFKDSGWEICDGRDITSEVALPKFRGTKTPNLVNRFLKGGETAYNQSGSNQATTSSSGEHSHKMPESWYDRGLDDGKYAGIDTLNASVDKVHVQSSGRHEHVVPIEPSATSVIYLMRVR